MTGNLVEMILRGKFDGRAVFPCGVGVGALFTFFGSVLVAIEEDGAGLLASGLVCLAVSAWYYLWVLRPKLMYRTGAGAARTPPWTRRGRAQASS